jgi:hypothetical protein
MTDNLRDGVWVHTRGSWGQAQAIRPLGPTWPGEVITARREVPLVMGRATAAPDTFWVPAVGTRMSGCCAPARYLEQLWDQVPGPS